MSSTALLTHIASSPFTYLSLALPIILILLLRHISTPTLHPFEPPLIAPRIPFLGHIINLLRQQGAFYTNVYATHPLPIATLPMADKRMYMLTSPALIQAAMRSRSLSFEPFMNEFAQKMVALTDAEWAPVPALTPQFIKTIHASLTGDHLAKMNLVALNNHVAFFLNKVIPPTSFSACLEIPDLYAHLKTLVTLATADGLYGPDPATNPFRARPSLIDDLWDFDSGLFNLIADLFPRWLAPQAVRGRANLQEALGDYYEARLDENPDAGVSEVVRARAAVMRAHGIVDRRIGRLEIALVHVAAVNTLPTLFWFVVELFARPEAVARARAEVERSVLVSTEEGAGKGGRKATLDITKLTDETHTPFLISVYREVTRKHSANIVTRRVMEDVEISDGEGGRCFLKKDADVQMIAGVTHLLPEIWGADADEFVPDRFAATTTTTGNNDDRKKKSAAMIPFGGGKHLCPGRNFAYAENMGLVAALLLGFEAKGLSVDKIPSKKPLTLGHGIPEPAGQTAVTIGRREGWEDVKWGFTSS
ncbi:cytochrome P450 [Bombardia bombarda]|uniref:Cytochrome P450 n=1 Tax=Bombardia bombarda TaxID=252184 RepID=A0AA39XK64_9PEZI|nr:cytochrome P450 [Bombardia bombarda]